jgi:hypothetical protein
MSIVAPLAAPPLATPDHRCNGWSFTKLGETGWHSAHRCKVCFMGRVTWILASKSMVIRLTLVFGLATHTFAQQVGDRKLVKGAREHDPQSNKTVIMVTG